ncbi:hypothetical protein BXZ70DRAFT_903881 [Cristinia sonorae]|uniref:Uncharacterized protein n=1 Tax=Cristinia sonorae TaxID=1940300 RepID=A0A8K0XUP3_9AGAR|nr:hypothetical protein BXZ70DRAFT_903881 [Cristinia sonorae]
MAMAYVPFAPSIPHYQQHRYSHGRRPNPMATAYYHSMPFLQRQSPLPTGPVALPPVQPNLAWTNNQSCLFGASFPADLSAALPQSSHKSSYLPEGDFSPLGAIATGTDFPPSPSDTCTSTEAGPSPSPVFVHAVCNAPLVAPVPLPYHSPTFLQFDLPDDDEDLSHPPYVYRPHKRKRSEAEEETEESDFVAPNAVKRRLLGLPVAQQQQHAGARQHAAGGNIHSSASARFPLRRWPAQPGASHGTGIPG